MKIKVEVKNDILGDSVFWEGNHDEIAQIRNKPARQAAERVASGLCEMETVGMWVVSKVDEQ